jgi:single-strand DNA-binding protein
MASFNKVILAGNLCRDPEVRYTPKGTAVCKFSIAVNRKWKNEAGEQKEDVTFVDIDSFGKQAETVAQWFKKGNPILVEGRLKLDQWEDKNTKEKRSKLGVVLEGFSFLGGKSDAAPKESQASNPEASAGQAASPPPAGDDSDIPF